jgi:hypothetical protein
METKPPVPRAILVGIQVPSVDDVAHAASIEELGRLVKTLGYEVVGTMSQKRDGIGGATVLGKGRLEELASSGRGAPTPPAAAVTRWREMDSNCRYPANFFGAPSDPHAIRLPQHKPASLATGTDGSNLSPSSGDLVRTLLPLPH